MTAEDIQADFDPEAYDRAMEKVFDASYYAEGEEEKPQFSDLGEGEDEMEGGWDDRFYRIIHHHPVSHQMHRIHGFLNLTLKKTSM